MFGIKKSIRSCQESTNRLGTPANTIPSSCKDATLATHSISPQLESMNGDEHQCFVGQTFFHATIYIYFFSSCWYYLNSNANPKWDIWEYGPKICNAWQKTFSALICIHLGFGMFWYDTQEITYQWPASFKISTAFMQNLLSDWPASRTWHSRQQVTLGAVFELASWLSASIKWLFWKCLSIGT